MIYELTAGQVVTGSAWKLYKNAAQPPLWSPVPGLLWACTQERQKGSSFLSEPVCLLLLCQQMASQMTARPDCFFHCMLTRLSGCGQHLQPMYWTLPKAASCTYFSRSSHVCGCCARYVISHSNKYKLLLHWCCFPDFKRASTSDAFLCRSVKPLEPTGTPSLKSRHDSAR